jgi:DNA-directed RNA polymerase subunit K
MIEQLENQFTRYEVARILGARALQIAMDAPLLLKISEKELEEINYNPIEIAKRELVAGVLPITVNRPLPKKKEAKIKKLSAEEIEEIKRREEEKRKEEELKSKVEIKDKPEVPEVKEKAEGEEGEEVVVAEKAEEDEIMELATPEDEVEEQTSGEDEGV